MKFIKDYKMIAIIQILVCICFFINPGIKAHGIGYGLINFIGAGILFFGSVVSYFSPKKNTIILLIITMAILILLNTSWYIIEKSFITLGFPIIAYDILYVTQNIHFLRKELE